VSAHSLLGLRANSVYLPFIEDAILVFVPDTH